MRIERHALLPSPQKPITRRVLGLIIMGAAGRKRVVAGAGVAAAPSAKRRVAGSSSLDASGAEAAAPLAATAMGASPRRGPSNSGGGGSSKRAAPPAEPAATFTDAEVAQVHTELLSWYDRVHRVMPWRRNPHSQLQQPEGQPCSGSSSSSPGPAPAPADLSPQAFAYRVWVSEVMLQQTQVATVIPYFNRWVSRWPTLADLAAASQEDVNAVWAGLGYYRRARYLREGALHLLDKHGGSFPETAAALRQVPGVGPYTAAAVASIAFSDAAAAVDGNVVRVLSRLRRLTDPKPSKLHDALAAQLLHKTRPGCHNQAMMELGATVCRPQGPDCGACPLQAVCAAHAAWREYLAKGGDAEAPGAPRVTLFPGKAVKADKKEQHVAVCVLKVLLRAPAAAQRGGAAASSAAQQQRGAKAAAAGGGRLGIRSFFRPAAPPAAAGDADAVTGSSAGPPGGGLPWVAPETEAQLVAAGAQTYYLLTQRPEGGLLAGLWEFPSVLVPQHAAAAQAPGDAGDLQMEDGDSGGELLEEPAQATAAGGDAAAAAPDRSPADAGAVRDQLPPRSKQAAQRRRRQQQQQQQQQQQRPGGDFQGRCRAAADAYMQQQLGVVLPGAAVSGGREAPAAAASAGAQPDGTADTKPAGVGSGSGSSGSGTGGQLVRRSPCGSTVHIFSHIRQTLHVEVLVVAATALEQVCPVATVGPTSGAGAAAAAATEGAGSGAAAAAAAPDVLEAAAAAAAAGSSRGRPGAPRKKQQDAAAGGGGEPAAPMSLRWVKAEDLLALGLTAGVRKVLGLVRG